MVGERGRPLVIAWRPGDDDGALKDAYRQERRADVRPRLHALWLLRTGRRVRDVAQLVGVHERTVQRWLGWYRDGGIAAVRAHRQAGTGQPSFLTAAQQAQLREQAATGAFRTAAEVQQWVRATGRPSESSTPWAASTPCLGASASTRRCRVP